MFFFPQLLFPVCFEHDHIYRKGIHFVELVFKCKIKQCPRNVVYFALRKGLLIKLKTLLLMPRKLDRHRNSNQGGGVASQRVNSTMQRSRHGEGLSSLNFFFFSLPAFCFRLVCTSTNTDNPPLSNLRLSEYPETKGQLRCGCV